MYLTIPKIVLSKNDNDAKLPYRNCVSDAGYILSSCETKIISNDSYQIIKTGLVVEDLPKGLWMTILPIKELESKYGIVAMVDHFENSFREEITIRLYNTSDRRYYLNIGDPIAKLAFLPLLTLEPEFKYDEPLQQPLGGEIPPQNS